MVASPSPGETTKTPLHIFIVGAGLVGLSAGISLRKQGHHVEIFERSHFLNEVGAAIAMTPNADRLLESWGVDRQRARGVEHKYVKLFKHDDNEGGGIISMPKDLRELYGNPYFTYHRVDLHNELKRLAVDPEEFGRPCTLHLGSPVVDCNPEEGSITIAGGETFSADLVVAADGIHSSVRQFILKQSIDPHPAGHCVYRTIIPLSDIIDNPSLSWLTSDLNGMRIVRSNGPTFLVAYPCRDKTLINVGGLHIEERLDDDPDRWNINAASSLEAFLKTFSEFAPRYREFIKQAKKVTVWPLPSWNRLPPTWINGRACLMGDAAHAMFPSLGQGGAMGIEDAAALGTLLPLGTPSDPATIANRLAIYEGLRKPRVTKVSDASSAIKYGSAPQSEEERLAVYKWLFSYDAVSEATKALKDFGIVGDKVEMALL